MLLICKLSMGSVACLCPTLWPGGFSARGPSCLKVINNNPLPCAGAKTYSTAVDVWSLGCIMAELLSKSILFQGKGEIDQLKKIFDLLGNPTEHIWPGWTKLPNASKVFLHFVANSHHLFETQSHSEADPSLQMVADCSC